jgi:outer membrane protein insertion porin family
MFSQNELNNNIHIHAVQVQGLKYTAADLVQEYVNPIIPSKTVVELIENTTFAYKRLSSLGIFKSIKVLYDYAEPDVHHGGVIVTLVVEEAPRIMANASTGIKGTNGYFDISGKIRNLNGRGLHLESRSSYGILDTQNLKSDFGHASFLFSCLLSRPRLEYADTIGIFNESQTMDWSGISLFSQGVEIKRCFHNKNFAQELLYNLSARQVHSVQENVPWSIRKYAGHSLKSSLGYSISMDSRDDSIIPTNGNYFKLFFELAGLGGNVFHFKNEMYMSFVKSFMDSMVLTTSVKTGFCLPLNPAQQNRINDRFLVGGPTNVRGFKQFGLGPKINNLVLGGDLFWALGASIFAPIPFLSDNIFKLHLFSNAASLVSIESRGMVSY